MDGQTDNPFAARAKAGTAAPAPERLAAFDMNDFGNGMRLILMGGGEIDDDGDVDTTNCRLLYLLGLGWIGFNGRFWDRECGEDEARKLAHRTARALRGCFDAFVAQGKTPKDVFKFMDGCGSAGATSSMLKQAQSYLTVRIEVFDRDPLAINCRNGTLKMRFDPRAAPGRRFRTWISPHDPADRITRMAAVDYDPDAEAPLFRGVVQTSLPEDEERAFFKRLLGYAATGRTEEQAFALVQGRGRDGKSTILDACREALGTYGVAASPDTFLEGGMRSGSDAAPDLIALSGDTRLAVLSEPKRGAKFNEGLLKAWTSGSPISARDLHSKPINFRPKAKIIFECNAFPVARGDDDGIWRRVLTPQFRHQVPEDEMDRLLPEKLRDGELPGILNWLVEGVGDWLETGSLAMPESLKSVLDDYRKSSSPFGDWLRERCWTGEKAGTDRELSGVLYNDFKKWFEDQGFEKPMSTRAFGDALRDRQIGLMGKDKSGLKYRGPIRLKTIQELAEDGITERPAAPAGHGGEAPPMGDPTDPDAYWRAAEADESPFG
jgi:putative DNA primase/helicase